MIYNNIGQLKIAQYYYFGEVMARTKKTQDLSSNDEVIKSEPTHQVIIAPMIESQSALMNENVDFVDNEKKEFDIESTINEPTLKIISVFADGEFVEELPENSPKIDQYLSFNKKQLEENIHALNEEVNDANILIYFHEGIQDRKYSTFHSYYAQNGLAPKECIYKTWMDYYKKKFHLSTEEEIAIKAKGNLKYSFSLKLNDDDIEN